MSAYDKRRELWGLQLQKGNELTDDDRQLHRLYQFLAYRYWMREEYLNVQQTITAFADAANVLKTLDKERAEVVAYVGLTLFSIAVLKMCGSVIAVKSSDIHNEVRRYIFGGAANALERNRLMKLLCEVTNQKIQLEPAYTEAYYNRAVVGVRNEGFAAAIEDMSAVIGLEPLEPRYYMERAQLRLRNGDADGATLDLEQVLALSQDGMWVLPAKQLLVDIQRGVIP